MSKGKVSEKMQRAVRKLQSRMSNPNQQQQYHNLSSDEASPRTPLRQRPSRRSDEEECEEEPWDVPEGFLAVYVGSERQRFVISANYLKHPLFKLLLEKSAEEYGFEHTGGLPIACDVDAFENLLWSIQAQNPGSLQLNYCSCFSVYSFPRS